jgi:hypothetical protein
MLGMHKRSKNEAPRRSAFVPRLAFGCATVGMSVVPVIVAASACEDSAFIGIRPVIPGDASPGQDSGFTGILPYVPDAAMDGIVPYIPPDAGPDTNAGDADAESDGAADAEGDGAADAGKD